MLKNASEVTVVPKYIFFLKILNFVQRFVDPSGPQTNRSTPHKKPPSARAFIPLKPWFALTCNGLRFSRGLSAPQIKERIHQMEKITGGPRITCATHFWARSENLRFASFGATSTGSRCRPYNLKFSNLAQILEYDGMGQD
jgi:hypothetical protein